MTAPARGGGAPPKTGKTKENKPRSSPTEADREPDHGFDRSHGYGPGHGGPTGPGDVPAEPVPSTKTAEEQRKDDEDEDGDEG
jgi:hypothetical protein